MREWWRVLLENLRVRWQERQDRKRAEAAGLDPTIERYRRLEG